MACAATKGRAALCSEQVGGYKNIYFADFDATIFTGSTITTGEITALASTVPLFKYALLGELHSVDENGSKSRDNGTSFFETAGTFVLHKLTKEDRDELKLLMAGRPHIIVEDWNGDYRLFGLENGCDVVPVSNSGAAMGDLSGYTIAFTAKEKDMAPFVDSTLIDNVAGFTPVTSS